MARPSGRADRGAGEARGADTGVRRVPTLTEEGREGVPVPPKGSSDVRVEHTSRDWPAAHEVSTRQQPNRGAPADASLPPAQLSTTAGGTGGHCSQSFMSFRPRQAWQRSAGQQRTACPYRRDSTTKTAFCLEPCCDLLSLCGLSRESANLLFAKGIKIQTCGSMKQHGCNAFNHLRRCRCRVPRRACDRGATW